MSRVDTYVGPESATSPNSDSLRLTLPTRSDSTRLILGRLIQTHVPTPSDSIFIYLKVFGAYIRPVADSFRLKVPTPSDSIFNYLKVFGAYIRAVADSFRLMSTQSESDRVGSRRFKFK